MSDIKILDCTFRDGGYYNAWDFSTPLINTYLEAMKAAQVDIVELGFRFLKNSGFKGPCAYATDEFIRSLSIPQGLEVGVMLNGADLLTDLGLVPTLERLFPETADTTPVGLVRFACHYREFEQVLPAVGWLAERGYDPVFGARPLRRLIQSEIQDRLAMALLSGGVRDGDLVRVDVAVDGDSLVLTSDGPAAAPAPRPGEDDDIIEAELMDD